MKGSIRLVLGLLLVFGGVGGIDANEEVILPLDSLLVCFVGLGLMAWGAQAMNKEEQNGKF